jgi:hypothetical protein
MKRSTFKSMVLLEYFVAGAGFGLHRTSAAVGAVSGKRTAFRSQGGPKGEHLALRFQPLKREDVDLA